MSPRDFGGPTPKEMGIKPEEMEIGSAKEEKEVEQSALPEYNANKFLESQGNRVKEIERDKVGQFSGQITSEQFEKHVGDAVRLVGDLLKSQPEVFKKDGREQYAKNIQISLENFVTEEVIKNGVDANELKDQILSEYERVRAGHFVAVNVNYKSLEKIVEAGKLKRYEEIGQKRRDGKDVSGRISKYGERRIERDAQLGYQKSFIVGALGTDNGYDDAIGPAPFYGHGVIKFTPSGIENRTEYFEGDSMTNPKTASEIIPEWLLRKWDDIKSRKLDEPAAVFSKALMEVYLKRSGYTHIHLMYVEAHVFGDVNLDDFESISYATGTEEQVKESLRGEISRRKVSGEGNIDYFESRLAEIEEKEKERASTLSAVNDNLKSRGSDVFVEIKNFDKKISVKDGRYDTEGARKLILTGDQLF